MLDSGFMPPLHLCSSDRNMTGGGCGVVIRPFCITILYIIIYCYLLIYFVFEVNTYVISLILQCSPMCMISLAKLLYAPIREGLYAR